MRGCAKASAFVQPRGCRMKQILYMEPVLKERIWGGERLRDFGYSLQSDRVGECWGVSAHPNGCCRVRSGPYDGRTLADLWSSERELFGGAEGEDFPLLIKLIDARTDLSIQVHPDDRYAFENENGAKGKTECWYVVDATEGATIIIGHHAESREEFRRMVGEHRYSELLREIPVKVGDFFQIDPGCVHAIKGGTLILETQTNSDVTYRIYDYDRLQNGALRPLHTKQAIDVVEAPFCEAKSRPEKTVTRIGDCTLTCFSRRPQYTVYLAETDGTADIPLSGMFHTMSVLSGSGFIDGSRVTKGDHLILSAGYGNICAVGSFTAMITRV